MKFKRIITAAATIVALGAPVLLMAQPASAAARNGVCDSGEFCYYYNSDEAGSISDFTNSVGDYGTTEPSCYDFKGSGCRRGHLHQEQRRFGMEPQQQDRPGLLQYRLRRGRSQDFAPGAKGNLNVDAEEQRRLAFVPRGRRQRRRPRSTTTTVAPMASREAVHRVRVVPDPDPARHPELRQHVWRRDLG